jgi:SAM-dependent methyltransferase
MPSGRLPPELFRRIDESDDADFYTQPRLVAHIDDATIARLTQAYRELVPAGGTILDLMTSWISTCRRGRVRARAGLGMNREELQRNPRLTECVVRTSTATPELPYPDATFDAVLNAVSIQYLTRPIEVYASVCRVLRPGGVALIATSHRCFPTKAILAWHSTTAAERLRLIERYFELAGGFAPAESMDRSPPDADPLWLTVARKSS